MVSTLKTRNSEYLVQINPDITTLKRGELTYRFIGCFNPKHSLSISRDEIVYKGQKLSLEQLKRELPQVIARGYRSVWMLYDSKEKHEVIDNTNILITSPLERIVSNNSPKDKRVTDLTESDLLEGIDLDLEKKTIPKSF